MDNLVISKQKNLDSVTKIETIPSYSSTIRIRPISRKSYSGSNQASQVRIGKFFAVVFISLLVFGGALLPASFSFNYLEASDENLLVIPVDEYGDLPATDTASARLPIDEGLGDRYVLVNLAEQKIEAYDKGERVFEAIISSGHEKRPTPKGEFKIINKAQRAYSEVAQLYMPYWMAFTYDGEYWLGFHELPEYPDGSKEGEEHLGQPYSGGCIRLGVGSAEEFYNWASIGDQVLVY